MSEVGRWPRIMSASCTLLLAGKAEPVGIPTLDQATRALRVRKTDGRSRPMLTGRLRERDVSANAAIAQTVPSDDRRDVQSMERMQR